MPRIFDELRPNYGAELFRAMKPNRFAGSDLKFKGRRGVDLGSDVAEVPNDAPPDAEVGDAED